MLAGSEEAGRPRVREKLPWLGPHVGGCTALGVLLTNTRLCALVLAEGLQEQHQKGKNGMRRAAVVQSRGAGFCTASTFHRAGLLLFFCLFVFWRGRKS